MNKDKSQNSRLDQDSKSNAKNISKSKSETKKMKILFADDEIHLQELIAAELPRMGHTVTVCPDGLTAVAAIEKERLHHCRPRHAGAQWNRCNRANQRT